MDYRKLYNDIIENRRNDSLEGYTEKHHIIPRCLGGADDPNNLVNLSAREHFLCHFLLTKIYRKGSNEWFKMNHAFIPMKSASKNHKRYYNSRLYEAARNAFSDVMRVSQTGKKNSQFGTRWTHNSLTQESRKIQKTAKLPVGWEEGRIISNWGNETFYCLPCGTEFKSKSKRKYCSKECRNNAQKTGSRLDGREEEFLTLYKKYGSMNKALIEMGYDARGARYYWAKTVLNNNI